MDRGDPDTTVEHSEAALAEFRAVAPTFGEQLAWSGLACAEWPHHADPAPTPVSAPGAAPILVVGTTGDPATPYVWAESLAADLESGVLLSYDGFVHTAYMRAGDDCVDDAVDAYLIEGEVPPEGTMCP